jgi:hypothetical protein
MIIVTGNGKNLFVSASFFVLIEPFPGEREEETVKG